MSSSLVSLTCLLKFQDCVADSWLLCSRRRLHSDQPPTNDFPLLRSAHRRSVRHGFFKLYFESAQQKIAGKFSFKGHSKARLSECARGPAGTGSLDLRDQSYVPSLGLSGTRTNISETKSFLYKRN